MPLVRAVVVNHNTSLFSELAVRSLLASTATAPGFDLETTVVDNHSSDAGLQALKEVCADRGVAFERSRFPATESSVNTHGDVLRDFVLVHEDADHFLFVDADIDFEQPHTVATMLTDLDVADDLWAVQARFRWPEENRGDGASLDIWAGKPIALRVGRSVERWDDVNDVAGVIQPRVHPGATLVRNTELFRRVAEFVGFSCAVRMSQDEAHAGFFDTFGLSSAAMTAAGYRYVLSRAVVHHFFMASYDDEHIEAREHDCRERLSRFAS